MEGSFDFHCVTSKVSTLITGDAVGDNIPLMSTVVQSLEPS